MKTDEEKAEEYVSPKVWGDTYYVNCCGDWSNEDMKKAYLDGLAEGRKELEELKNNYKKQRNKRIDELQKEKAELKEQIESLANTNIKAQNIIADLKAEIESLKDTLKTIATDTNEHITHNVAQNELDKWELEK